MREGLFKRGFVVVSGGLIALLLLTSPGNSQQPEAAVASQAEASAMLTQYCAGCHSASVATAGVVIDPTLTDAPANAETWERVIRQLRAQSMPPPAMPRPEPAVYGKVASFLETEMDRASAANPNPGDLPHLHRLTRTEYANAIRDLLGLEALPREMDYPVLLPADNASSGFDNLADLLFVSPAIMDRYIDAALKISRLAVGDPRIPLMINTHRLPAEQPQVYRVDGMPLGTRGGISVESTFPLDAEYIIQVEMAGFARDPYELELSIDGERVGVNEPAPPARGGGGRGGRGGGGPIEFSVPVPAGPHLIGVTFAERTRALPEGTLRSRNRSRGPLPAIGAVVVRGPYNPTGPGDTPSRRAIFTCKPASEAQETACATEILTRLTKLAYRRPVTEEDVAEIMEFYEDGRAERDFDYGIQASIERLLVSPQFLYRIERDPAGAAPGSVFEVSDLELASRLSFFLWSSIPDEELLDAAAAGRLSDPAGLREQTLRMLADDRSETMVTNFAAQWLFLRDVAVKEPDLFLFQDFDENLREGFARETELFLDSILRSDRSVLDLLTANHTFVNERLAEHYGIPNIRGSRFRRYEWPEGSPRAGLLGQGSVLLLTSYSTRTSPVLRGKYVLENLLASPPPPPPPDVPSLDTDSEAAESRTLREAMILHRANPACASCHARMDPIGFAMENFDAVGRWRDEDSGNPIEVSSTLADGTVVDGVDGVRKLILADPERFVDAVTEKLLMYAAGRNVQYYDAPAIRKIVSGAASGNYKFADLVVGVVSSVPFQMRGAGAK